MSSCPVLVPPRSRAIHSRYFSAGLLSHPFFGTPLLDLAERTWSATRPAPRRKLASIDPPLHKKQELRDPVEAVRQEDQYPRHPHEGEEVPPLHFGQGVGVAGPDRPYRASIVARISRRGFPPRFIAITSRVMPRQSVQVAPWLVYVTVLSPLKLLM
jgi:hypothetical protein